MAVSNEQLVQVVTDLEGRTGDNRGLDEALVDEARAADHPLHNEFEWNDATAANQHRLAQANRLIKLARIEYPVASTGRMVRVPAVVRNPLEPRGSYIATPKLRDERDVAIEVIRREFERIHNAWRRAERVASTVPEMMGMIAIERERVAALVRRLTGGGAPAE